MKIALLAMLLASLTFTSVAVAEEWWGVGFQGIRVSMETPEFDLVQLSTVLIPRIEVSLCELAGESVAGGFTKAFGLVGLTVCGAAE